MSRKSRGQPRVLLVDDEPDLLELLDATIAGRLEDVDIRWDPRAALCVVMASGGYPDSYHTGLPISGLPDATRRDDLAVFHAGTRLEGGQVVTAGGRVLGVTALGATVQDAVREAYWGVEQIAWDGMQYRRDIGHHALERHA